MSLDYTYHGHRVMITRRSNAVKLILRYTPGRDCFDLTIPPGCSRTKVDEFLAQNLTWMDSMASKGAARFTATMAPGERAWLQGRLVTLGQNGIPAGNAFLRLRTQQLSQTVSRLLKPWCGRLGVSVSEVVFRQMRSKWGSCIPAKRKITLNTNLGAMPEPLTEYVLVHELTHLIHPDHSPAFHAAMTRVMPDWKERKTKLNGFGELFLPPDKEAT